MNTSISTFIHKPVSEMTEIERAELGRKLKERSCQNAFAELSEAFKNGTVKILNTPQSIKDRVKALNERVKK